MALGIFPMTKPRVHLHRSAPLHYKTDPGPDCKPCALAVQGRPSPALGGSLGAVLGADVDEVPVADLLLSQALQVCALRSSGPKT